MERSNLERNKKKRRRREDKIRRFFRKWAVPAVICILVIAGTAGTVYFITAWQKDKYEASLKEKEAVIDAARKVVFVALNDISAGDMVIEEMVELIEIMSSEKQETYMTLNDFNKIALIDIKGGTSIHRNMLGTLEVGVDIREVQYSEFFVTPNINVNDYCDLRIVYPNGETYVVLSKKRIVSMSENQKDACLWMTPEEINRMQGCIVDAYLYSGTKLFLTKYIEPSVQKPSQITYTPSSQCIDWIMKDPNIVEIASEYLSYKVRLELENRLLENKGGVDGFKERKEDLELEEIKQEQFDDRYFDSYTEE